MRTTTHNLPNYKIDPYIGNFENFSNYNGTIVGAHRRLLQDSDIHTYQITHWRTLIADIDPDTGMMIYLSTNYISQTTSRLVGRIVRQHPEATRQHIEFLLNADEIAPSDAKRILKMIH